MAKTGRPKADNPRSMTLHIRLTEKEHSDLEQYAQKHGLTKTAAVLKGLQRLMAGDV